MDNLYNSATFSKVEYNYDKKVLIFGVTRKGIRDILQCIKQEVLNSNNIHIETWGTYKVVVFKGDKKLTTLLKLVCIKLSLSTNAVWFQNN